MALDRKPDDSLETKLTTRAGNVYALYCLTEHGNGIVNDPNAAVDEKKYALELKVGGGQKLDSDFILAAHRALIRAGAGGNIPFITRPAAAGAGATAGEVPFSRRTPPVPPPRPAKNTEPEYKNLFDQFNTSRDEFRTAYNTAMTTADEKIQSVTNRLLCVNSKGFMKRPTAEEWTEAFDIQPAVDALDKMKSDLQKKYDEEVKKVSQVNQAALADLLKRQNDWIEEERTKLLATQAYFQEDLQKQIFDAIDKAKIKETKANDETLAEATIGEQLADYHKKQLKNTVFLGKDSKGVPIEAKTAADMKEGTYKASELGDLSTCHLFDWFDFCGKTWKESKGAGQTLAAIAIVTGSAVVVGIPKLAVSTLGLLAKPLFSPTYTLTESGGSKNVGWSSTSFYNSNRYRDKQIDGGFDRYLLANPGSTTIYLTLGSNVSLKYIQAMDDRAKARGLPPMKLSNATRNALATSDPYRLQQIENILSRGHKDHEVEAQAVIVGQAPAGPAVPNEEDKGFNITEAREETKKFKR